MGTARAGGLIAVAEANVPSPSHRWPRRQDFDKFYGFVGGETNQWAAFLLNGVMAVELPNDPNYHCITDMTDGGSSDQASLEA